MDAERGARAWLIAPAIALVLAITGGALLAVLLTNEDGISGTEHADASAGPRRPPAPPPQPVEQAQVIQKTLDGFLSRLGDDARRCGELVIGLRFADAATCAKDRAAEWREVADNVTKVLDLAIDYARGPCGTALRAVRTDLNDVSTRVDALVDGVTQLDIGAIDIGGFVSTLDRGRANVDRAVDACDA